MSPKIRALEDPPILFAHRGASAVSRENTIEAFELALRLGANGLESDVWATKDQVAALDHDGRVGGLRRRRIGDVAFAELPEHIPSLSDLFAHVGVDFALSLDIKHPDAVGPTVQAVRQVSERTGHDIAGRTWLCHPDLDLLTSWRSRLPDLRLVHSTRLGKLDAGPERHAAQLYDLGIDAVNFRHMDWTGGLTALYHRFDIRCFGWDVQLERIAAELLNAGIDGIFGDHVDRLTAGYESVYDSD